MKSEELTRSPEPTDPLFDAGYAFVDRHISTADAPSPFPAWHGWMVRQAFWEGARWARDEAWMKQMMENDE